MHANVLRSMASVLLLSCSLSAQAKSVTMGDITVNVPDSFQASESNRGIEVETTNKGVMAWFETYKGSEDDDLRSEHDKYWKENDVSLPNDPVHDEITQTGGAKQESFDYKDATWKGKPTVLRYIRVGPLGPEETMILVTLWASPDAWDKHSGDISGMLQTLNVTYKK